MRTWSVKTEVRARASSVFELVASPKRYAEALPHIEEIKLVTEQEQGVGTQFEETRLIRGQKFKSLIQIHVFEQNRKLETISDDGSTVWRTIIKTEEKSDLCELNIVLEAQTYKLLAKLITFLCRNMIKKELEKDLAAIKRVCES